MHSTSKMKLLVSNLVLILLFNFSFAQNKPTHFKTDIDFGNGTILSTFLNVVIAKGEFTITSPKDADVRIFGGKAKLGRAMGKSPKKGILMTIRGQQKNDSLFGETNIPVFGKLKFKEIVLNQTLSGSFFKNDTLAVGTVRGVFSTEQKNDYSYLYPMIIKTIEDNIYSKSAVQNKEWKKFKKTIQKLCTIAYDDMEMYLGFNILNQSLPFTHLYLLITKPETDADETDHIQPSVVFEEKNGNTAYLKIKNFSNSTSELATALPKIAANPNYKNLIVDLRDNGGGGIDAAFEFARYITDKDMEVGYFLTNKLQYAGYQPELFRTLPELQPKSTKDFTDDLQSLPGVKLIFKKPDNAVFEGNIYVLTNGNTGSTCEPMVYALKNTKRAKIIGEKTAGAMLAAVGFEVSGKYTVMLPIADFYTYNGVRLDKVGVSPDIEVKSEDALTKALELIQGKS